MRRRRRHSLDENPEAWSLASDWRIYFVTQLYDVQVNRINESKHQDAEFSMRALTVTVGEDGVLRIEGEGRKGRALGASSWGSVTITRVV